jgi:hypothetical protein
MGFAKQLFERGISSPGEKYVCWKCFGDYAIREFIKNEAKDLRCDYCGRNSSEQPIAAHINDVIGFILDGIESEWDDPANSVGWEGGWMDINIYDILRDIDLGIDKEELFDDIAHSIMQKEWYAGLSSQDEWYYDWEEFSNQVKHQIRYVFFNVPREKAAGLRIERQPHEILERIGVLVNDLGLTRILEKGTIVIRCRNNRAEDNFSTVDELGPPEKAKNANRMSPAGIPMFYGSFDEETAISENYDSDHEFTTLATFATLKSFRVLDLTKIPSIPSLFDQSNNYLRPSIIFMHSFLRDLSKPIQKDEGVHIEYVPTQVVTEYFRHIFRDADGEAILGIFYPSSRNDKGTSCVLFFQKENCIQDNVKREFKFPWQEVEAFLSMDSSSVKIRRINPKS